MTDARRAWRATFADPAVLAALVAGARDCMGQACTDDPEKCSHAVQMMTPLEFAQWVERELFRAKLITSNTGLKPQRNEPAGRPGRRTLAAAAA